jgi:hypothetical protein
VATGDQQLSVPSAVANSSPFAVELNPTGAEGKKDAPAVDRVPNGAADENSQEPFSP